MVDGSQRRHVLKVRDQCLSYRGELRAKMGLESTARNCTSPTSRLELANCCQTTKKIEAAFSELQPLRFGANPSSWLVLLLRRYFSLPFIYRLINQLRDYAARKQSLLEVTSPSFSPLSREVLL
jgi:hypothetical protein